MTSYDPDPAAFALVLVSYLQVPGSERRRVLGRAADALAAGGELLMIGHALRNLAHGVGGPSDPSVLWDPAEIAAEVRAVGLDVERCDEVERPTEGAPGGREAIDLLVKARRPS